MKEGKEKKVKVLVTQSCPNLCDPVNCSLPDSSVLGILQTRIPKSGLPFPSPVDLPDPGNETRSPALQVKVRENTDFYFLQNFT